MKVVLFNLKHSENLGDGALAEALEHGLRRASPNGVIRTCDLAGRRSYGHSVVRNRSTKLRVLAAMPPRLRRLVVAAALIPRLRTLRRQWRQELEGADLAVFGGGHLFQDDGLNFPMKIGAALALCAEMDVPVAVHAVGVSKTWSPLGRALFGRLLTTDCRWVAVRDADSCRYWSEHLEQANLPKPVIVPDGAFLMEEARPPPSRRIGLNVVHPALLAYHASPGAVFDTSFYREVAEKLIASGHEVTLFTNGATEDEEHLDHVMRDLDHHQVRRAARPEVPQDLIDLLSELRAMIGYRLHASIICYRMGIPTIGIGWDGKIESFYSESRRPEFFLPADRADPDTVLQVLERALVDGIDPDERQATVAAAQAGLSQMLDTCRGRCS